MSEDYRDMTLDMMMDQIIDSSVKIKKLTKKLDEFMEQTNQKLERLESMVIDLEHEIQVMREIKDEYCK